MLMPEAKILKVQGNRLLIETDGNIAAELARMKADRLSFRIQDPRHLSDAQRRKVWAICRDIADWMGDAAEYVRDYLMMNYCVAEGIEPFSLSDADPADMETCRGFISYLMVFCIRHGVPCKCSFPQIAEEQDKLLYACLYYRKCTICGRPHADVHHYDVIGMGRDRDKICHIGMRAIALCREHHMEAEQMGKESFSEKYYGLTGLYLTGELCRRLGLNGG